MKRVLAAFLLLSALSPLAANAEVVIRIGPPPVVVERPGPPPRPGYAWIAGYYRWTGRAYMWVPGHYVVPPRPWLIWVPSRWVRRNRGWVFMGGHWR